MAVIAVLGVLLSLAGLYYSWRTSQPRVRVKMETAIILPGSGSRGPTLFVVTAANLGRVPVRLTSVGVELRAKGETAVFMAPPPYSPPLSHTLEPQRAWQYHIDPAAVILWHVDPKGPVRAAFVNDETGRHWRGRISRSWLDSWARPG